MDQIRRALCGLRFRARPKRDIFRDGVRKEEWLLRHISDRAPQHGQGDLPHVEAINEDGSRWRIVEPRQQADQRRLPRPGRAHDRERLARFDRDRYAVENGASVVREAQVPELDAPADIHRLSQRGWCQRVAHRGLDVEHLEHPLPGRHAALQYVRDPAEGDHRPAQHDQVGIERDELTDGDPAEDDLTAAEPQHQPRAESQEECQARIEESLELNQPPVALDVLLVRAPEPLEFHLFPAVRPDDPDTRQRFLDDRAHVGKLSLYPFGSRVDRPAE